LIKKTINKTKSGENWDLKPLGVRSEPGQIEEKDFRFGQAAQSRFRTKFEGLKNPNIGNGLGAGMRNFGTFGSTLVTKRWEKYFPNLQNDGKVKFIFVNT